MKIKKSHEFSILLVLVYMLSVVVTSGQPGGVATRELPRQVPPVPPQLERTASGCNDGWDTSFTTNGVDNLIDVIVNDGAGNVYIGGRFTSVGGTPAVGIAKWDGTTWSALGTGVGAFGEVKAIAVSGSDVYIGGAFFFAASNGNAKNVAKWNGSSWSALGAGLGGGTHLVEAVAVLGSDVYFGGNFNVADGSGAEGIVRWNGTAYSPVGGGIFGQVSSIVASGGLLYVGGNITPTATNSAGLLKWDGTTWSTMGLSLNSIVETFAISGTNIFVVGSIRIGAASSTVGRFNASTWTPLGGTFSGIAKSAAVFEGDLYVGGQLSANGFNNIVRWTGTTWATVGPGLTGGAFNTPSVNGMAVRGDTLVVGGSFTNSGNVGAKNIALLSSGVWSGFQGTGIDAPANAIAVSGTDVYLGGSFVTAGPVTANKIVKWNSLTNTWSALGSGISGFNTENSSISAIAVAGSKVYAGGTFSTIGGISANNIAVWDGTAWAPLGTGVNARVTAIIAKGDEIYVGGAFATAGGVAANRVAKWNGTSWSGLGASIVPNDVTGMTFLGNDLYVGSGTTTVANPAYFAKFDGTNWTALGADLGDRGVSSVAAWGPDVYVSGGFNMINGVTVNRVAKWNGTTWSAMGNGLPSPTWQLGGVRLAASGNDVLAIGDFTVAGGGPADRIAKWNGTSWTALGAGLNASAATVVAAGGDIFAGGSFTMAGCNASPYFARYRNTVWTGTGTDWHTASNWASNSVPATDAGVTISAGNAAILSADVVVSDLIVTGGRTVTIASGRTLIVNRNLDLSGGIIAGDGSLVVNGNLNLNSGDITNVGSIVVNGNLFMNGGKISGPSPVSVTACRSGAVVGGSSASFIASPLTRCVNTSGTYRFPVGTGSTYAPVTLANIAGTGNFTVDAKSGAYSGPAAGLSNNRLQRWWNLTNGGIAQADISFSYADVDIVSSENRYRAFRINGGVATQLPTVLDPATNRATVAGVTSFSPWTLAEGQPGPSTLFGRASNPNGRGAAGVIVTLADDQGNVRTAVTNPFGYYRFLDVLTFRLYMVRVTSKKFTFPLIERTVDLDENTPAINFVSSDN